MFYPPNDGQDTVSSVASVPDVVTVYILASKPISHWFLLFLFYTLCTGSRKVMSPTRKTLQTFDTHSPLNTRMHLRRGWPSDVSSSTEFDDVLANHSCLHRSSETPDTSLMSSLVSPITSRS